MGLSEDVARYYEARAAEYDVSAGYANLLAEDVRAPIKRRYQQAFRGHDVLEIACGTGYWTEVISKTAKSVLATDVSPAMVNLARKKLASVRNVKFHAADAYSLDSVPTGFTAAFAHWWWSHVPKLRLKAFLAALHGKLKPGAFVLFVDQLPSAYESKNRRQDAEGNLVEERVLDDGRSFLIVKNFPTEQEIRGALEGVAEDVHYEEHREEHTWSVSYRTRG